MEEEEPSIRWTARTTTATISRVTSAGQPRASNPSTVAFLAEMEGSQRDRLRRKGERIHRIRPVRQNHCLQVDTSRLRATAKRPSERLGVLFRPRSCERRVRISRTDDARKRRERRRVPCLGKLAVLLYQHPVRLENKSKRAST